jgi:hypothetical protein
MIDIIYDLGSLCKQLKGDEILTMLCYNYRCMIVIINNMRKTRMFIRAIQYMTEYMHHSDIYWHNKYTRRVPSMVYKL